MIKRDITDESLILKEIINDTIWMARRYAEGRCSYAAYICNTAIDKALAMGVKISKDTNGSMYANDGMYGEWDTDLQRFKGES